MSKTNNTNRRKTHQEDAIKRQEVYNALSVQQKIDKLDKELGKDIGAVKQRAKLQAILEKEKNKAKPKKEEK